MKKTIKITVTKQDIQKGKWNNGKFCPVAIAIRRYVKDLASVGSYVVFFKDVPQNGWGTYLSRSTKSFIIKFDKGEKVIPFTFKITVPEELVK